MNKLYLMKNPDLFQGEKFLKKNKSYFEGWYFKNSSQKDTISFIPGMNINQKEKKAFIQVITNHKSYFINYDMSEFQFNSDPFWVKIGNNFFSKDKIHIDINDKQEKVRIIGDLYYTNHQNITTNWRSPNIMGPFSYLPFMECNHAILSMKNNVSGFIKMNNKKIEFHQGTGYIEKDWGTSFPKSYIWLQGNQFPNKKASFMLSIADIPFRIFHFKGVICALIVDGKEYKFTTYNNTKIRKYEISDEFLNVILKKGSYTLTIQSICDIGHKLSAPVKGKMEKDIIESISSNITVTLKQKKKVLFSDNSKNCGLEIVKE